MMGKLFFAAILTMLSTSYLPSQRLYAANIPNSIVTQDKVAVRPEDLPEPVKSTLANDGYADWKVAGAYLVTKENNTQYYEINLKKGDESSTVNLDKYGRKVD